jgi:glycosyltransferase involved in cell wall biosynthesis
VLRVGVDGKCLLDPRAGVARYLEGLLAGVGSLAPDDLDLAVITPKAPRRTLPWVLWDLQRATGRGFDLFHFPFYYPPFLPRCPISVAIHDVLILQHPQWFPHAWAIPIRLLLPRGARRAEAVVACSRATAEAVAELCHVPQARIRVVPMGVDRTRFAPPDGATVAAVRARLGLTRPYLLQLGAVEPRRGSDTAIAATSAVRARASDLDLVLVGEMRAPVAALASPPQWLRRLGRVADDDLPPLLAGAEAVLAPSRGEGFDLPVLEALACGAVVVASDIAVHLEHFAPAVELFESGNSAALAAAVKRVIADSARAACLRAVGPELARRFTWEESARRHLELWREMAGT